MWGLPLQLQFLGMNEPTHIYFAPELMIYFSKHRSSLSPSCFHRVNVYLLARSLDNICHLSALIRLPINVVCHAHDFVNSCPWLHGLFYVVQPWLSCDYWPWLLRMMPCVTLPSLPFACLKQNGKRSHGPTSFYQHHNTIDQLVTLQVLMDEFI